MLFHMYQVFSSLQGHLHFFVHFFFTFMEHFFIDHPISGVQKKGTFSHFQHNQDYLEQKSFYSRKYRQSAISEPILVTFGGCQNCQNQTFNWPYQLYKSKYEKYFFVKRNTIMLFCMYQVFSSLLGHLHFFVHFSFTFMEHLFFGHPISISDHLSQYNRDEDKIKT